ncbi:MAG: efflux RND transporter periplasmic adaptor subunit [Bacteroidota bacterium]
MLRRRHLLIAALILAGTGLAVALSPARPAAAPPPIVAAAGTPAATTYGLGTVEARILSRIGFDIAGTVAELSADHGDHITRGQVLARLDNREQAAKVAQAEAGLRQAQAALVQAQARLDRARAVQAQRRNVNVRRQSLVRNGTVSVEAAEDAQSTADVAAADVAVGVSDVDAARGALEAAKAALLLARTTLDKHNLLAPYDGVVVERSRELGTALPAGTALFTVADPATIWVQAFVDEARAGPLRLGQPATIVLRSLPDRRFAGHVVRIGIESDRVSEERRVHVAFDAIPADIHLGEQAEAFIDTAGAAP